MSTQGLPQRISSPSRPGANEDITMVSVNLCSKIFSPLNLGLQLDAWEAENPCLWKTHCKYWILMSEDEPSSHLFLGKGIEPIPKL